MEITALGDLAWRVTVGREVSESTLARVLQLANAIRGAALPGVREVVPAFTTVTVHLEPNAVAGLVREALETVGAALSNLPCPELGSGVVREIPVVYGGESGPDLAEVARHHAQSPEDIAAAHAAGSYRVHAIGFAPGFPYLAGLSPALHTPRRDTPRTRVEAGSVGIGGGQTGVYPIAGPGGWNVIGRTVQPLFDVAARPPAWLQVGDRVRFVRTNDVGPEVRQTTEQAPTATGTPPTDHAGVEVLHGGSGCSIQDGGRWGWQAQGVSVGGAADAMALRVANMVVGNAPEAAGLEWTMRGPRLLFHTDMEVALCGATVNGLTNGKRLRVQAGEVLDLSAQRLAGCRGYVALRGGIEVPAVLGSRSTDLRGAFGGLDGRFLRSGDHLPIARAPADAADPSGWRVTPALACADEDESAPLGIRVVRGPDGGSFSDLAWKVFLGKTFRVSPRSDRMGIRLQGGQLTAGTAAEQTSAGVAAGAVQVPPDGKPIILLADCQTLGGYPQIAYVIAADQARLAQAVPGRSLRFKVVDALEAERARHRQLLDLRQLAWGLEQVRLRKR